jgi:hypothetical protein
MPGNPSCSPSLAGWLTGNDAANSVYAEGDLGVYRYCKVPKCFT